jgi:uncharacterized repeat protein (TIGR03803 family)
MTKLNGLKMSCVLLLTFAAIVGQAQSFTALAILNGDNGQNPWWEMTLAQGIDGSFYGTTVRGGSSIGNIFRIEPNGTLNTVNFDGSGGAYPTAGVVLSTDGDFYGTTSSGGTASNGVLYKFNRDGKLTTIYDFCGTICSGPAYPEGPVILGTTGNFYGTSANGGNLKCEPSVDGCGTVFELTPKGVLTAYYSFCTKPNCPDGYAPYAGLTQGTDGNFYGATTEGGIGENGYGFGTIFKITPGGHFTTLYNFCSQPNCADGTQPFATLIQAADGDFYGTTTGGGNSSTAGTVFKITPTGILTTLYSFCAQPDCADGGYPYAPLMQATDGNFYGTTSSGGTDQLDCSFIVPGCGTVFEITPAGVFTTLHYFSNTDGASPRGGLLQATSGTLYGTASYGGDFVCPQGCGTIFSLDVGLGPFVTFVRRGGKVGKTGGILGQGFTGTTNVSLNGTSASFTVVSDTYIRATVPIGATTGYVTVTTPSGTLTSNVPFHVIK